MANLSFADCNKPGHLQIHGRHVLAVRDRGRFVSDHDLDTGKADNAHLLSAGPGQGSLNPNAEVTTTLRVVGPNLYLIGPRSLMGYRLDPSGTDTWHSMSGDRARLDFRAAIPTRKFMLMISAPLSRHAENTSRIYDLQFYKSIELTDAARAIGGRVEQVATITEMAGIVAWQAVDGGVYYLDGDHKLHFLRGTEGATK